MLNIITGVYSAAAVQPILHLIDMKMFFMKAVFENMRGGSRIWPMGGAATHARVSGECSYYSWTGIFQGITSWKYVITILLKRTKQNQIKEHVESLNVLVYCTYMYG